MIDSSDWKTSSDWRRLLEALADSQRPGFQRKVRLAACACCGTIWNRLTEPKVRLAVERSERFADGRATRRELKKSKLACEFLNSGTDTRQGEIGSYVALEDDYSVGSELFALLSETGMLSDHAICEMLREVIDDPNKKRVMPPEWLRETGGEIRRNAQSIYDGRRFEEMPALADALEEKQFPERSVIEHLRSPSGHVRGCWALDLVQGCRVFKRTIVYKVERVVEWE